MPDRTKLKAAQSVEYYMKYGAIAQKLRRTYDMFEYPRELIFKIFSKDSLYGGEAGGQLTKISKVLQEGFLGLIKL